MDKNKESAVSPAVAVILIVAMTCLMAAVTGVVILGMADISANDKRVSMIVDIADGEITMTPVYNSATDILNGYTTYLSIIYDEQVYSFYPGTVHVIDSEGKFDIMDLSFIKIIGHFSDGSDEIIFTGRVVDGKIVSTGETEKCYITFTKVDGENEEVIRTVSVYKGCTASALPFDLKNPENTIDGWYTDSDLTVKWDFEEPVTKNITLYVQEYYPYFRYGSNGYSNTAELITAINSWKKGTILADGTICKDIPLKDQAITINGELSLTGGDLISTTDSGLGYPTDTKPHIWASPKWDNENPLININGGTLKIDGNLVIDGNGKMSNSIILLNSGSDLNINSGELTVQKGNSNGNGGGIYNKGGTITVTGALTVKDNKAIFGGGIYNDYYNDNNGMIQVDGALTVSGNIAVYRGGGIYNDYYNDNNGMIQVDGALTVSGNIAVYRGGGIYNNLGTIDLKSNTLIVSGNKATDSGTDSGGGGIYNYKGTIKGDGTLTVSKNEALNGNGGGIYNTGTITNSDPARILLEKNEAGNGGGIYNGKSGAQISVTATGNTATNNGGGVYNTGDYVEINGKKSGNTATNNGGGVCNKGGGYVKINGKISGNTAKNGNGGGIWSSSDNMAEIVEINCEISGNTATNGGGILTGYLSEISGTVTGNTATYQGGGIYNTGTINVTSPLDVSGNTATDSGGGIYNNLRTINVEFGCTLTVSGNTAKNGGGICNYGATIDNSGTIIVSGNGNGDSNGEYKTINGGGIFNTGTINVTGVLTLSGNTATTTGREIYNRYTINVESESTFTVNGKNNPTTDSDGIHNEGTITYS